MYDASDRTAIVKVDRRCGCRLSLLYWSAAGIPVGNRNPFSLFCAPRDAPKVWAAAAALSQCAGRPCRLEARSDAAALLYAASRHSETASRATSGVGLAANLDSPDPLLG